MYGATSKAPQNSILDHIMVCYVTWKKLQQNAVGAHRRDTEPSGEGGSSIGEMVLKEGTPVLESKR